MLLVEIIFLVSEKQCFPFVRYSWLWKQFFRQVEKYFLTNSSFRLVETDFLSGGKTIFLFRAMLKLLKLGGGNSYMWKLIFWLVKFFFLVSQILLLVKAIFRLVETDFWTNLPIHKVDTYFLSCGNCFLLFDLFFY